jgi:hypothetical protein
VALAKEAKRVVVGVWVRQEWPRAQLDVHRRVALALHMIVGVIADPRAAGNWREASERRAG